MYQCLAAIDIGSNTVHLVVAATDGEHLTVLADESIFVRLAAGVWSQGYISEERMRATVDAIETLAAKAREFGASRIIVVTTEVARKARNTQELISTVRVMTGIEPLVLSGQDEAMLTFHGVTHGRHLPASVVVADLGGGSLEVIITELGYGMRRTSLPLGSAFMHDRFALEDPPQPEAVAALRGFLAGEFEAIPQFHHVDELLVCGGTVNALLRLVQQAQGRAAGDRVLRRADLDAALAVMLTEPAELVAERFRLRLERARLLPAGAIVLAALVDHLRLPQICVSQAGIREGIILAAAHYGDAWLEGARQGLRPRDPAVSAFVAESITPFQAEGCDGHRAHPEIASELAARPAADVAWKTIHDLTRDMLRHHKAALKGDVEAVHDMRVAARRLRTLIEIFQPCFPAQLIRRLNRVAGKLARALGDVRDADVALDGLTARLKDADPELAPGLRYLIKMQRAERRAARRKLRRALQTSRLDELRDLVDALRPVMQARADREAQSSWSEGVTHPAMEEVPHA